MTGKVMTSQTSDPALDHDLGNLTDQAVNLVGRLPGQVSRIRVRAGSAEIEVEWQSSAAVGDGGPVARPVAVESSIQPAISSTAVAVLAPVVGIFYAGPAPDEPPFVTIGERVTAGQQIGIIEAMKLMNHISAEIDGTITAIHVSSGESVEFDQILMEIEPS
jgi:acetyl-CoA carboxylase biotin carboxyl carrier protein